MIDLLGPASASGAVTIRPGETRTFGLTDTWFRDCSDPTVDDGTEFIASWFNAMLANARSVARGNGQTAGAVDIVTQDNGADDLLWRAMQHLYQRAQPAYADDTGIANSIVVALSPSPPELKKGMRIRVKILHDITGATVINVNALAAVTAKTVAGQDLQKGMLIAGQIAEFVHDGTYFQLVSVYSEKVVFTPRATLSLAAIASIPYGAWSSHTVGLSNSANMTPTINGGGASFSLPAGTYMFVVKGSTRVNYVANATEIAHGIRLTQNATQIAQEFEASYLIAGADLTTYRNLVCVLQVAATDLLAISSWAGTTFLADYTGGNAGAGSVDIVRIGN